MEILPSYSQYVFSLLLYMVNSKHLFTKILEVHNHGTRSANNFPLHFNNLTNHQKGDHHAGIKIFNNLPIHLNCVVNDIQILKLALKRFLPSNSFCFFIIFLNSNKQYIL